MAENIEDLDFEALKAEATELGIKFNPAISAVKLKERIDSYYDEKETDTIESVIAKQEAEAPVAKVSVKDAFAGTVQLLKERANKTRIVTIIDNDQRINGVANSFTVNCTNEYFDLGTYTLPLNLSFECKVGFLDVIKEIMIPMHTVDPRTLLSRQEFRHRFTIQFDDGLGPLV